MRWAVQPDYSSWAESVKDLVEVYPYPIQIIRVTHRKFLWWPTRIGDHVRWLEWATIEEQYVSGHTGGPYRTRYLP